MSTIQYIWLRWHSRNQEKSTSFVHAHSCNSLKMEHGRSKLYIGIFRDQSIQSETHENYVSNWNSPNFHLIFKKKETIWFDCKSMPVFHNKYKSETFNIFAFLLLQVQLRNVQTVSPQPFQDSIRYASQMQKQFSKLYSRWCGRRHITQSTDAFLCIIHSFCTVQNISLHSIAEMQFFPKIIVLSFKVIDWQKYQGQEKGVI